MSSSKNKSAVDSTAWHSMEIEEITEKLKVDLNEGLSVSEASSRLEKHGENKINKKNGSLSFLRIFVSQFATFSSVILASIAVLLLLFGNLKQSVFVTVILLIKILFGYIQQSRANTRLQTIFEPHTYYAKLFRGGRIHKVQSELVVPGDLIALEPGDRIPADARLIKINSLVVDESVITGKADPSAKDVFDFLDENAQIVDRANMVYGGSYVLEGIGYGIVVATGTDLELNKKFQEDPDNLKERLETDVQIHLRYLNRYFKLGGIILALLLMGVTWLTGGTAYEIFTIGFSIIVASIPIGLLKIPHHSVISTAFDLFKRRGKVKRLGVIESLGKIDTLCTEARGYFTDEDMAVKRVFIDGQLLEGARLDSYLNKIYSMSSHGEDGFNGIVPYDFSIDLHLLLMIGGLTIRNKPEEVIDTIKAQRTTSIENIVERAGIDIGVHSREFRMVEGKAYSARRKQRSLIMKYLPAGMHYIFTLGDTQAVIENCSKIQLNGRVEPLDKETHATIFRIDQHLKQSSVSVFSVAYRPIVARPGRIRNEQHSMIFMGMLALEKHVREGALKAVERCRNAGIKIIIMTDEDPEEAFDATSLLGITDDRRNVIDCQKISQTDFRNDERYVEDIDRARVFSKPTLQDKHKILSRLRAQNRQIAMTINQPEDLQSIKDNDVKVNVAMPSMASDAAVNAADILIYENGFKTITDAVILAKEAYYTIKKSIRWILSSVIGQILTLLIGGIIYFINPQTFEIPLTLSQIVWINLLVSILPSFALSPSSTNNEIFYTRSNQVGNFVWSKNQWDIVLRGTVVAVISLISFFLTATFSIKEHIQTATCTTLIFTQLITNLQCYQYSNRMAIIKRIFMRQSLWITVLSCIVTHLAIIYIPFTQQIIDFNLLDIEWVWIIPFCLISMLSCLLTKNSR